VEGGEVVARACPMFKNKNKFLGMRGQLLKIEIFISPGLSTTPQPDPLWFDTSFQSSVLFGFVVVVASWGGLWLW